MSVAPPFLRHENSPQLGRGSSTVLVRNGARTRSALSSPYARVRVAARENNQRPGHPFALCSLASDVDFFGVLECVAGERGCRPSAEGSAACSSDRFVEF